MPCSCDLAFEFEHLQLGSLITGLSRQVVLMSHRVFQNVVIGVFVQSINEVDNNMFVMINEWTLERACQSSMCSALLPKDVFFLS